MGFALRLRDIGESDFQGYHTSPERADSVNYRLYLKHESFDGDSMILTPQPLSVKYRNVGMQ